MSESSAIGGSEPPASGGEIHAPTSDDDIRACPPDLIFTLFFTACSLFNLSFPGLLILYQYEPHSPLLRIFTAICWHIGTAGGFRSADR